MMLEAWRRAADHYIGLGNSGKFLSKTCHIAAGTSAVPAYFSALLHGLIILKTLTIFGTALTHLSTDFTYLTVKVGCA